MRQAAINNMLANPDDYKPFIDEDDTLEKYCNNMSKNTVWGGQMELNALAKAHKFNVIVHKIDSPSMAHVFHEPIGSVATIHLSYHMGSHYNSIRRSDDPCRIGDPPIKNYVIGHNLEQIQKDFKDIADEPKSKIRKLIKSDDIVEDDSTSTNSQSKEKEDKEDEKQTKKDDDKEDVKEDDDSDVISQQLIEYALNFTEASPDNIENIKLMKFVFELIFT
jgi:hypothetical protein